MKMIIQCDFDGTVTMNNLSVLLRERFASSGWQDIESDYLGGRLTVEESNRQQYALVRESRRTLKEFARQNVVFRPGFLQFVEHCRAAGMGFAIVSSGLDFYIEAALKSIGAPELELHCARTSFGEDGILVTYLDPQGNVIDDGFKKRYLTWFKGRNEPVVYIGDGLSDFEAASAADHVFALDHLHRLLGSAGMPHYTFADFSHIWHEMRQLGRLSKPSGW